SLGSTTGPTISSGISNIAFAHPISVLGFSRTATICTFALPRLVTVIGWPVSATSSVRARQRALKAAALVFLSMQAGCLCDHTIWSGWRHRQRSGRRVPQVRRHGHGGRTIARPIVRFLRVHGRRRCAIGRNSMDEDWGFARAADLARTADE